MCEPNSDEWQTPKASEFDCMESVESCAKRLAYDDASPVELTSRLDGLTVSDTEASTRCPNTGDGNDSGVDAGMARHLSANPGQLQRASSTNSAGYASSGGQDAQFASCNSSLLSVCSDSADAKLPMNGGAAAAAGGSCQPLDLTSEGGSESSSLSGDKLRTPISVKKRVSLIESSPAKSLRSSTDSRSPRARNTSISRAASCRGAPTLQTTERARSRDNKQTPSSARMASPTRRMKAQTPSGKEGSVPPADRIPVRRASSVTRKTPASTPSTEDGRWPSTATRSTSKVRTTPTESLVVKTKCGPLLLDNGRPAADRFMTLPARRKRANSDEDLTDKRSSRSSSTTRDRMTSSAIVRRASAREPATRPHVLPRSLKLKTMIYHEAAMQTVLTCRDIDDAFAGVARDIPIEQVATVCAASQVDIRDKQIEQYEHCVELMNVELNKMKVALQERSQVMAAMEQQMARERDDKVAMERELQSNTKRVLAMLDLVHGATTDSSAADATADGDSLLLLESQIQLSGHILEERQCEINTLRQFCKELQTEMNRSQMVQQSLLDERKCFERETTELQDFLQDEKAAIVEALRDAETEVEASREKMKEKDANIERLQDECRHLIRISEQRR